MYFTMLCIWTLELTEFERDVLPITLRIMVDSSVVPSILAGLCRGDSDEEDDDGSRNDNALRKTFSTLALSVNDSSPFVAVPGTDQHNRTYVTRLLFGKYLRNHAPHGVPHENNVGCISQR